MKKVFIITICIIISLSLIGCSGNASAPSSSQASAPASSSASAAASPLGYTFRNTTWGMNMDNVAAAEGKKPDLINGTSMLYMNQKIYNMDCSVYYLFSMNQLIQGSYLFNQTHTDLNADISDYTTLAGTLAQQYGAPKSEQIWKNDEYKNDPSKVGLAVSVGDLTYISTWNTPGGPISLDLVGQDGAVTLSLIFSNPALSDTATN